MKTIHTTVNSVSRKTFALSAAILGVGAALAVAQPAQAAPRRNNGVRQERQEQRDVQRARQNVQQARQDLREQRQDLRQERREDRFDNRFDNRRIANGRYDNRYDSRRYDNGDNGNDTAKLLGAGLLGAVLGAVIAR